MMMKKYFCASDPMFLLTFTTLHACLVVLLQSFSAAEELILDSCNTTSNYTSSSQFKTNLNLLLLPSHPVTNDASSRKFLQQYFFLRRQPEYGLWSAYNFQKDSF
ncbi:hypothetical protein Sjap_003363 [Stephania japonica]|uniref:Uncharacterized protein n=1 Tax=Stephania japonica TaxID=461633 RepID=A0AAP0KQ72_9MAGN